MNHAIVSAGGLILYCDFLCDSHSTHVEATTWLVVNHVRAVVAGCVDESPVQDFVMALHRSPASSGLLFQAVASKCDALSNADVGFLSDALRAVENAHPSHGGKLLLFLVRRFLKASPILSLARTADAIACARVEAAINEPDIEVVRQDFQVLL